MVQVLFLLALAASLPGSLEDELPNSCWSHDGESDWKNCAPNCSDAIQLCKLRFDRPIYRDPPKWMH